MGVNSIRSTTVDTMGFQDACRKRPEEDHAETDFHQVVTEVDVTPSQKPAAQQQASNAPEPEMRLAMPGETSSPIAAGCGA